MARALPALARSITLALAVLPWLAQTGVAQNCVSTPIEFGAPAGSFRFSENAVLEGDVFIVPVDSGVAVHERNAGGPGAWGEVTRLMPTGWSAGSYEIGAGLSGDTASFGADGEVFLYERGAGGAWSETRRLAFSDPFMGVELDLDGDFLAVSSGGLGQPEVFLFERNQGGPDNWGQVAQLTSPSPSAMTFGRALDLDGDLLAVGDDEDEVLEGPSGAVTVYGRGPGGWAVEQIVVSPNGASGQRFGAALALDGDTLLVGATLADTGGLDAGAAWVFERDLGGPGAWGKRTRVRPNQIVPGSRFGSACALADGLALVGAPRMDQFCPQIGEAYLFSRDKGGLDAWELSSRLESPVTCSDRFGSLVQLDASAAGLPTSALVGAPFRPQGSSLANGSLFVYGDLAPNCKLPYCTAGTSASGCRATISASGPASASASSGFQLAADQAGGGVAGLFFFGVSGPQAAPWGNGTSLQCVNPPVVRTPLLSAGGTAGACDGSFALDLNALWCPSCPAPGKNPGAGALTYAQLWYRDPLNTSNQTTSLSNAVRFPVVP